MPSKFRKKTPVHVLEWDAIIHSGEYICSEFLSFVSRFGYCRCRPRCLFQVLVFLFKRLQKTRMRSKRRQPHLKVTTSLCKRVCFATNNFCSWHWKYSTQTEEALLIFSEVLKFDLRKKFSMNPRVHFRFAIDLAQQKAIGERKRDVHLT